MINIFRYNSSIAYVTEDSVSKLCYTIVLFVTYGNCYKRGVDR